MKKIMPVFGTRPEAIKMCPLVKELKKRPGLETVVCVTGQHRQMLDSVLQAFRLTADYDVNIMRGKQTLFDVTTAVLQNMKEVLEREKPDVVLVHGDTTTACAAALACICFPSGQIPRPSLSPAIPPLTPWATPCGPTIPIRSWTGPRIPV